VDVLYFNQQRQLQHLRQLDTPLCESDVKPADRFLMERFIRAAFCINGDIQSRNGHMHVRNPRLTPCDYHPTLKTVSIDIETRGHSTQLYSIAAATLSSDDNAENIVFMLGQGEPVQRDGYRLVLCDTEKQLLLQFLDWVQHNDPDVLIVSHELLGNGKLITPEQDKVATINRLFNEDKPQLADYNIRDCTLVNEIFIKADLLAFALQRANLTGLALDRLGGSVAAFDNLYLPKLHRAGYVAPDVKTHADAGTSPGGYVMDSKPGLFRNVLVLDFKSLYPSIIRTFFIDPMGLAVSNDDEQSVPGFVGAQFSRTQHILPELIEALWAERDKAKIDKNAPLSQAIKIIMNSFYGILGSGGCRFYSQQLASSITLRGHDIIQQSRSWIEQQGYEVIYGDTDSVFVYLGKDSQASQSGAIGTQLMNGLNDWWQNELQTQFGIESHLEVEFETHYSRFFMPTVRGMSTGSKKRYAGLSEAKLVVKGLEAARTDWTPLARRFQRELFLRVFNDEPFEDFIRQTVAQLHNGKLDEDLVYRKRIRRNLQEYQRNVPPHIKAARKLPSSGNTIRYLITRNGPEPAEALESTIDYQHYFDKQLAPAADGILQFLDTSVASITDAQLQMF